MNANDYLTMVKNPNWGWAKSIFKGFQKVEQIIQGQGNYHSETSYLNTNKEATLGIM